MKKEEILKILGVEEKNLTKDEIKYLEKIIIEHEEILNSFGEYLYRHDQDPKMVEESLRVLSSLLED